MPKLAFGSAVFLLFGCTRAPSEAATPVQPVSDAGAAANGIKLFAEDVVVEDLPLSISIETLGGVSTVLIPRGTSLPNEKRETFSTASDKQASIEVHVLVGDRKMSNDNATVARFHLRDIPPARRGIPQIEVTFALDRKAAFQLLARDKLKDIVVPVSVEQRLPAPISRASVQSMVNEAEAEAAHAPAHRVSTPPD